MKDFIKKLKVFLHDPIDKCFDIKGHIQRAKNYAEKLGISGIEDAKGSDHIASCMERSMLPKNKVFQSFSQIRHPFCKEFLEVENYDDNSKEENVFSPIANIYQEISKPISNKIGNLISSFDDKKKFFYLWRNLQDKIFQDLKTKPWIKYLPLLPADTRVPDHSIWEHIKIASAINAYWDKENEVLYQNNSLFLFTMGPVQSFIAQARKTQDFYMGSFILSFLTFKAMEVIIDKYGPTNIIYP
ncbi:MAG: type III-B CRISPR-associated protein Cas10/Cmr2, partial [Thermoplasmata archaeon]